MLRCPFPWPCYEGPILGRLNIKGVTKNVEMLEIVLVGVLVFAITKTKRGLSFRNYEN